MFTIKINKSIDRKMKWNIFAMMIISFCVSINIKAQRVVLRENTRFVCSAEQKVNLPKKLKSGFVLVFGCIPE